MIFKSKLLDKYLNLLLVFLLPTQLALHFWPSFSFIFGIRVDYLSPAIYLTDLLFIGLFAPWLIRQRLKIAADINKHKYFLLLLFGVVVLNLSFSSVFYVSLIKWLKIIEFVALGYYVKNRGDVFSLKGVSKTLFYSLVFFSLIGILQFLGGKTLDGALYFLGERSFSIFTPGIALVNLFGKYYLRIYSTFPHPNSFAGFLGVSVILIFFTYLKKVNLYKLIGLSVILLAFVLTFSLAAYVAMASCLIMYLVFNKHEVNVKWINIFVILVFLMSLIFSVFSQPVLGSGISLSKSFNERLELGNISGKIFSEKWLSGVGLNAFIINEVSYATAEKGVWLLQPVHNIFLLIISETGILGGVLLFYLLSRFVAKNTKNEWVILVIFFVLITGLFDHYWFTIQQNMLLLSLLIGISFREKI